MAEPVNLAELLNGALRTTPYLGAHLEAGAVFYSKGGWLRPLHYTDPRDEQLACRQSVALFDVHSMGKMSIAGPDAQALVEETMANEPPRSIGDAVYTTLCNDAGRIVDDLVIYRCGHEWFIICNTVSRWAVAEHLRSHVRGRHVTVRDVTAERAYVALQGPRSWDVLALWLDDLCDEVRPLEYYSCVELDVSEHRSKLDWCLVCRTGYTGELGFELIVPVDQALALWQSLRSLGRPFGLVPAGGAALQALRTEKGYRGFGTDIDRTMTPAEAGLGWTVRVEGRAVVGQVVLAEQSASPDQHCRVWPVSGSCELAVGSRLVSANGAGALGRITSSAYSPQLDRYTAIARFDSPGWPGDQPLQVMVDGDACGSVTISRSGCLDPGRERLKVKLS